MKETSFSKTIMPEYNNKKNIVTYHFAYHFAYQDYHPATYAFS